MLEIAMVLGAGIFMVTSFFLGALFGATALMYLKERKNDNADD